MTHLDLFVDAAARLLWGAMLSIANLLLAGITADPTPAQDEADDGEVLRSLAERRPCALTDGDRIVRALMRLRGSGYLVRGAGTYYLTWAGWGRAEDELGADELHVLREQERRRKCRVTGESLHRGGMSWLRCCAVHDNLAKLGLLDKGLDITPSGRAALVGAS